MDMEFDPFTYFDVTQLSSLQLSLDENKVLLVENSHKLIEYSLETKQCETIYQDKKIHSIVKNDRTRNYYLIEKGKSSKEHDSISLLDEHFILMKQVPVKFGLKQCLFADDGETIAYICEKSTMVTIQSLITGDQIEININSSFIHLHDWNDRQLLISTFESRLENNLGILNLEDGTVQWLSLPTGYYQSAYFNKNDTILFTSNAYDEFLSLYTYNYKLNTREILYNADYDIENTRFDKNRMQIIFTLNKNGATFLMKGDLQRDVFQELFYKEGKINDLSFGTNYDELLYLMESPTLPPELYCYNSLLSLENRITYYHKEAMSNIHPTQHEVESFDSTKIKFFLYEGQKEQNRNKCILYIHGGPEIQEKYTYNAYFQYLVHEGYSVCVPNVRGSTGYGKTFEKLDNGSNRLDCLQDLLYVNKWLVLNKNYETGLMGRSYGAFLELLALTQIPSVWKYGICIAGFTNLNTFLQGLSTESRTYRGFEYGSLEMYGEYHENVAPLRNVSNIQAPILMFHGDKDNVVPHIESIQFAEEMKKLNREITLYVLPNEGHKVQKIINQKFVAKEVSHFLNKIH